MTYLTPEYIVDIAIWIMIGVTVMKALYYGVYVLLTSSTMREVHRQQKVLIKLKKQAYENRLLEDINRQIDSYLVTESKLFKATV